MICAVVVAYYPESSAIENMLDQLEKQVDYIVVIDNTPDVVLSVPLPYKVDYIHQGCNVGIACAHNLGIKRAIELRADYVLLLDQDSHIPEAMASTLKNAYLWLYHKGVKLACVGPRPKCLFTDKLITPKLQRSKLKAGSVSFVKQIISSGKLIPIHVFDDVGFMDESLFIDGVDHEWCWRAGQKGYRIGLCETVVMPHRLGDKRGKILGMTYKVASPVRLYYQFRNIILLSRRGYVPRYWKFRNLIVGIPVRFVVMLGFEAPRLKRLKCMWAGLRDGLLNRMPIPPSSN